VLLRPCDQLWNYTGQRLKLFSSPWNIIYPLILILNVIVSNKRHCKLYSDIYILNLLTLVALYKYYTEMQEAWFQVLTAVVVKNSVFWDITPCSLLKVSRRFGRTYGFHLQNWRVSQARNRHEADSKQMLINSCCLLYAVFLLGLLFNTEDGGDMFLRNVGWLSMDYTAFYARK
jgi:hypothetical protein